MSGLTRALRILGYKAQVRRLPRSLAPTFSRARSASSSTRCRGEHGGDDRPTPGRAHGPRRLDEGGPGRQHVVDEQAGAPGQEALTGAGRGEGAREIPRTGRRVQTRLIGDPAAHAQELRGPATRSGSHGRRHDVGQRRVTPASPRGRRRGDRHDEEGVLPGPPVCDRLRDVLRRGPQHRVQEPGERLGEIAPVAVLVGDEQAPELPFVGACGPRRRQAVGAGSRRPDERFATRPPARREAVRAARHPRPGARGAHER